MADPAALLAEMENVLLYEVIFMYFCYAPGADDACMIHIVVT